MIHPIIVGTAGHVDHGKSSLVRRLTGVDPDRWEEEKERGLTIDLGFAPLELPDGRLVGMVDVPGHERFLKNMVAGATSVDLALLVVAADDGVMPQTREHLDALELLGVGRGLVALTKIDLVDGETLELAVADVRDLFEGRRISLAGVLPVSSVTGEGCGELKAALQAEAESLSPRSAEGLFRMPVQRVFSLHGFGTIVTGIPLAGSLEKGTRVEVVGKGLVSRVRGIHAYGRRVDRARAGHSTALNLPDLPVGKVERGDVISLPAELLPTRRFEARLDVVPDEPPLRHGESVHLHLGTREVLARVFLLDRKEMGVGEGGPVQILTRRDVVVVPGDRVLCRRLAPPRILAGGPVLGVGGRRLRRFKTEILERMRDKERSLDSLPGRLALVLREAGPEGLRPERACGLLGATEEQVRDAFASLREEGIAAPSVRGRRWFAAASLRREEERIEGAMSEWFRAHPMGRSCPISELRPNGEEELFQTALALLEEGGRIERLAGGKILDRSRGERFSPAERKKLEALAGYLEEAGFRPRTRKEVREVFGEESIHLLEALVEEGGAVSVGTDFVWGRGSFDAALAEVGRVCGGVGGVLEIPRLRDRMGTSRKFLMPFLEHLDRIGWTARKGDRRILLKAVPGL